MALIFFFDESHEFLRVDQFSVIWMFSDDVTYGDVDIGVSEIVPRWQQWIANSEFEVEVSDVIILIQRGIDLLQIDLELVEVFDNVSLVISLN